MFRIGNGIVAATPTYRGRSPDAAESLDDLLVRVATVGDKEAFSQLYSHFAPRIKGYLIRGGAAADALPWHGLRNRIEGVVRTGEAARLEHPIGDRWFEVGIFPRGGDRFAMLCANISARKEAEATLEAAAARAGDAPLASDRSSSSRPCRYPPSAGD